MKLARAFAPILVCVALSGVAAAQAPDPHAGHAGTPTDPPADARSGNTERKAGDHRGGHIESEPPPESVIVPPWIPDVTDEMRRAAFPDVRGHAAHDQTVNGFVLFDRLEWRGGSGSGGLSWANTGWVGGDLHRVWFRTEGEGEGSDIDAARVHVLYGRAVTRWWTLVAGVRQDLQPGAQTWLAAGIQGLAPGFFDVALTAYVSDEGQTAAHAEVGYDVLITNRLVLQPVVEMDVYGKANASIGVASGVSTGEAGIRLRYQFTREFAPYVGVSWERAFGGTADRRRDADVPNGAPRVVAGVRVWF